MRAEGAHGTASKYPNIHFCALFLGALKSSCSHDVVEIRILMLRRLGAELLTKTSEKSDKNVVFSIPFLLKVTLGYPKMRFWALNR